MKIRINDKKISEIKAASVLRVFRIIIILPFVLAATFVNLLFFPLIALLYGMTKANKYMDYTYLNWMEVILGVQ